MSTRASGAPVRVSTRLFFFFFPPVASAFLCISGLLCILGLPSCIWGIVVWVLGYCLGVFFGFGGFYCMRGILCILRFIVL
jgi:hypothetical protein